MGNFVLPLTPKSQRPGQLPFLVWCILKASRHPGVKRPGPEVSVCVCVCVCVCFCVCFLAVQETTPLQCPEALGAWLWGWQGTERGA